MDEGELYNVLYYEQMLVEFDVNIFHRKKCHERRCYAVNKIADVAQ